ncbi:MAG: YihA family ribosome biogenesis GTP-binding protein [Candidatus Zixiibacteriota bacterium]|nr:MAG: YihA family ribosome biogenesis GTP-binding protein [candidate division Zixibacteria bacterium]
MGERIAARFIGGIPDPLKLKRNPLPEVIFLGRSNVGKSSLINTLLNQKNLARTSSTPGKTRQFFFYEVDNRLLFVDPPGYGYAKVAQAERDNWVREMERYFRKSETLIGVVLIMDIRHAPMAIDTEMAEWLAESQIPAVYVLNKADKLNRNQRNQALARVAGELTFPHAGDIIPFSAQNQDGRKELWAVLNGWMEEEKQRQKILVK